MKQKHYLGAPVNFALGKGARPPAVRAHPPWGRVSAGAQSVIPALVPECGLGSVDVPEVLLAAAVEGTGGKCRTGTLPRATIAA